MENLDLSKSFITQSIPEEPTFVWVVWHPRLKILYYGPSEGDAKEFRKKKVKDRNIRATSIIKRVFLDKENQK